jgi:hypothetical protein
MATQNSNNNQFTNNADGFDLSGGTTKRRVTITGADVTLTGSGANTYKMPAATDTLVGRASTDTLTNKTITSTSNSVSTQTFTNPYKFSVYRNAAQNTGSGAFAIITFDTKLYDTSTNYSTGTGLFTAPIAGFYSFKTSIGIVTNATTTIAVAFYKNGSEYNRLQEGATITTSAVWFSGSIDIQLAINDTIAVYVFGSSAVALNLTGGTTTGNSFSGHLISTT